MSRTRSLLFTLASALALCASLAVAQDPQNTAPSTMPPEHQGRNWQDQDGQRPTFGKITSISNGTMQIARQDGTTVTVKLTAQTEYRKDRATAALTDFKVGDTVIVRGDENADHSINARMVAARTGGGPGGPGGPGGMSMGTLGKDYVAGEVKSLDPPRITVLRTDNVTQTLELNEETSLRRGRDSITMADIQVGDHLMARGAVQKDVFVPKGVMVMNAEQWQRMQQMRQSGGAPPSSPSQPPAPDSTPPAKP